MIKFEAGVKEAREILTRSEKDQWRLGEIAAELESKYGDATLEKFGEQIGLAYNTVQTYRKVYLAWKDEKTPAPGFSAAAALANHPKKADIVKKHPKITDKQARKQMQDYRRRNRPTPELDMNNVANQLARWFETTFQQQKYLDLTAAVKRYADDIHPDRRRFLHKIVQDRIVLLQTLVSKLEKTKQTSKAKALPKPQIAS